MWNDRTVGTCSLCGGPVQVPTHWYAVVPPLPTCVRCNATAQPNYGPVIPMNSPKPIRKWFDKSMTHWFQPDETDITLSFNLSL